MFKAVARVFLIAVMLIAFIGQSIAFNASVSCEDSAESIAHTVNKLTTNHDSIEIHQESSSLDSLSTDSLSIDNQENCCGIECCSIGCTCIANACSLFVYFTSEINSKKIATVTETSYLHQSKQPNTIPTLLYRPPIFTS